MSLDRTFATQNQPGDGIKRAVLRKQVSSGDWDFNQMVNAVGGQGSRLLRAVCAITAMQDNILAS